MGSRHREIRRRRRSKQTARPATTRRLRASRSVIGGEEYEIIATINPSNLPKVNFLAKKFHLPIFVIGKAMTGNGNVFVKYDNALEVFHGRKIEKNKDYFLLENKGFLHFS